MSVVKARLCQSRRLSDLAHGGVVVPFAVKHLGGHFKYALFGFFRVHPGTYRPIGRLIEEAPAGQGKEMDKRLIERI